MDHNREMTLIISAVRLIAGSRTYVLLASLMLAC